MPLKTSVPSYRLHTAVLLKYRTPTRDEKEMFDLPVQDAERALGLVRHHAAEWKLDPQRVGLLGFSAGANLAGHVSWDRGYRIDPQHPDLDDSRGPDFLVFIYGGGFLDNDDKSKFRPGFSIPADAPPVFMLVAHDDKSNPIEAAVLYLEYKKRGSLCGTPHLRQGRTRIRHAQRWSTHQRLATALGRMDDELQLPPRKLSPGKSLFESCFEV